ncbi:uncharacterized protein LOC134833480 isoform X2 [Culicoides brevitarsis]
MSTDAKVASFGKWTSLLFVFMTATFAVIKLGMQLIAPKKRELRGSHVLMTNGDSILSQKLGQKLEETTGCKVIYLPSDVNAQKLTSIINSIYQKYQNIDVIVHNGHQFVTNAQDEACFALNEGHGIVEILNILKHCIPKMYLANGGHIVSIKSNESSFQALIDTRNDFRDYILDLIRDTRRNFVENLREPEFSMSVIQCDINWSSRVSESHLVAKLNEAICRQKAVVRLESGVLKSIQRFLRHFNVMTESTLNLL